MSIPSFLSKLWLNIKSLFESLPADLQEAAHIAVSITENLKTIVDNPLADVITALIPGDTDNRIISYLRLQLPSLLQQLRLVDTALTHASDNDTVLNAAATVQTLQGDIQHSFLHDLAVLITRELSAMESKDLTWSEAVYIVEWYYHNKFKKTAL